PGDGGAGSHPEFESFVNAMPVAIIAIVITVVITVVMSVTVPVVTVILRGGVSCRAGQHGEHQRCRCQFALHTVLLFERAGPVICGSELLSRSYFETLNRV